MPLTVGKLKELIKDLSDDTVVVSRDDNYELRGAITELSTYSVQLKKFRKETRWFRDDFDGTNYPSDVYVPDKENGKEMLYIS
jgi:hypothetical protein